MTPHSAPNSTDGDSAPPSASRLRIIALAVAALAAGSGFSHWLTLHGTHRFPATLQAHTIRIMAGRTARIAEVLAKSGAAVTPGTPLLRLADDQINQRRQRVEQEIALREAELHQAQARADVELACRTSDIEREIFETKVRAADFLQRKYVRQMEEVAWLDALSGHSPLVNTVSVDSLRPLSPALDQPKAKRVRAILSKDEADTECETLAVQIQLCDDRLAELARLRDALPEQVRRSAGVDLAERRLTEVKNELAATEDEQQALTILSPGYGTVGVFRKEVGDPVEGTETVVELLDEERRAVSAAIPSSAVGCFSCGQTVRLVFPGAVERTGQVAEIPPQTTASKRGADATVAVRIEPTGSAWPRLPIGSQVTVLLRQ